MIETFGVQLRKELAELWHTRKLVIVVVVLVGLGLMSPVLAKITPDLLESLGEDQMEGIIITIPEPSQKDAIDQLVKNISQFGLLLAVLMSFGAIVGERERGQAGLMLAHPLPREVFVLAKFAAQAIMFGAGLALGALGGYIYTAILFDAPPVGRYLALFGLIYVWLLCLIALSLLASTLGRSMASAGGLAFVLIVVLLLAGSFTNLAPGALLEWGRTVAIQAGGPARWGALAVSVAVAALAVGASCAILRRQEIE
ncbi:MAG: ABC transporter permease [Chloroflexi bacterium]|nr:ABC transporter permease [Chloroflexota bacterium]